MSYRQVKIWEHKMYAAGYRDSCTIMVATAPANYASDVRLPNGSTVRVGTPKQARDVIAGRVSGGS